jgi:hypothetical protein
MPISSIFRRRLFAFAVLALAGTGACKDGSGPPDAPAPVITSLSPDTATAGRSGVSVTIAGSGFRGSSVVRWNARPLATTFVSETALRVTVPDDLMGTGGEMTVTVQTPAPGGGTSAGATFTVRNPVPAIASLSVDTGRVGYGDRQVTVNGTGFVPGAQVLWNGSARTTNYTSPTQLTFIPGTADVTQAGPVQLRVQNPQPGGGVSGPATFTVLNRAPFAWLPVRGGHAGLGGFTLIMHGEGFVPGAVVRWNGVERPATVISPSRLTVELSAADAAAPASIALTVVNPLSAGVPSNESVLTLRTVRASDRDVVLSPHRANDIVWDPGTQRLYITTRPDDAIDPGSLIRLDPYTQVTSGVLQLGSNPNRLVRTDNGQYLYVGLDGAAGVRRVTIAGFAPGPQFGLGSGLTPLVAGDMEAVPGEPNSVAVARYNTCCSPSFEGVAIYDNGVARPTRTAGPVGGSRITFVGIFDQLYGYDNQTGAHGFYTMPLQSSGVTNASVTTGLLGGVSTDIEGTRDLVYATDGAVIDPERRVRLGTLGSGGMAVAPDDITGRVYVARAGWIDIYDVYSFRLIGSIQINETVVRRLIRFGSDGLAYIAPERVGIIRDPIIAP